MKKVADKQILMVADFAGYPLKEAIKEYLEKKGWTVTDIGVKADSDPNDTELMFHRIGFRVGTMITEIRGVQGERLQGEAPRRLPLRAVRSPRRLLVRPAHVQAVEGGNANH